MDISIRIPSLRQAIVFGPLVFTIMGLIGPFIFVFTAVDRTFDRLTLPFQDNRERFDFIIVGGGSSGCALANKLSEDYSVLLLEAGGSASMMQYFSIATFWLYHNSDVDWTHYTVPQKNASFGLINNSVLWSNGKLLGGSSQLNAMMYIRGNVQGFDEIAAKTGDSRWSMKNVLKYYKDMENYHGWFESSDHGTEGSLSIERPELAKFTKHLMKAGEELGYPIRDPNAYGPYTEGFAMMDLYMERGRRSDAYRQFLVPIMAQRPNLVVRKYANVIKVLFREGTTEAYGVEYDRHEINYQAISEKEVIMSAGSINTAKLLMLSGIGPKNHLKDVGIETIVDLPVGEYLQDKYGTLIGPFQISEGNSIVYDRDFTIFDLFNWLSTGTGTIKSSLAEGTWAIFTESAIQDGRWRNPNIHTYVLTTSISKEIISGAFNVYNAKPEIANYFTLTNKTDSFFQLVTINHQQGHGFIKLKDANPYSEPLIDPKYLEDEKDFQSLYEGIKFAVKLVENTKALKKMNAKLLPIPIPGCESFEFKSDDYFKCLASIVTISAYKYSSTVPIGKDRSDPHAVVDSHLRVLGTKGLRVVDGSVLQQKHVSINDATCRMLGILASDIIKDDWNLMLNII